MDATLSPRRGSLTQDTLRLMQSLVDAWCIHPFIVQCAREITRNSGAVEPRDESKSIWRWVRNNVAYREDPIGTEWVQDPFETIVNSRAGDCDDMSVLCGSLLQAIGHPCVMAAIRRQGDEEQFTHAVCIDDRTNCVVDAVSSVFEWPPNGANVEAIMRSK